MKPKAQTNKAQPPALHLDPSFFFAGMSKRRFMKGRSTSMEKTKAKTCRMIQLRIDATQKQPYLERKEMWHLICQASGVRREGSSPGDDCQAMTGKDMNRVTHRHLAFMVSGNQGS